MIVSVRHGSSILENEIQNDTGDLGQVMQDDGTFITPSINPTEPHETIEQKIERLEKQVSQDNLVLFEVLATIYEELLMRG